MMALDATFLLDYLDGVDATRNFLADHGDEPLFAPSLALFEVYRGSARAAGPEGLDRATVALDWVEPLPLTHEVAREAARVEAELLDDGTPINLGDVLVAGTCRQHGASVVTRDGDFERVEGLSVVGY